MEDFIHPERREDEVFLGNMTAAQYAVLSWKTKRLGVLPYDADGDLQTDPDWFPVFLQRRELEVEEEERNRLLQQSIFQLIIKTQPI